LTRREEAYKVSFTIGNTFYGGLLFPQLARSRAVVSTSIYNVVVKSEGLCIEYKQHARFQRPSFSPAYEGLSDAIVECGGNYTSQK